MTAKPLFLSLGFLGVIAGLFGQQAEVSLISSDDAAFNNLKKLTMPAGYSNMPLPSKKDNTLGTYFSGIYSQGVWNCNQAASIWTMFTYEINCLRSLNSSLQQNQYSPMAVYNLLNYGNGSNGVSYFDSWNLIRANGIPGIPDFPGLDQNSQVWMTGYDKYFRGMKNRIDEVFAINVGNPEGLLTLKHWINDHLNGSPFGGLANFQIGSGNMIIPQIPLGKGLEEEGQFIVIRYDPNIGHAMTFAGWNDSVRYDVNGDGKYTNNIDINGDYIVDMKDWEIGAMRVVNSWSAGWGNAGKVWVMYRLLAESTNNGGIWNNAVMVVKPKKTYEPLLTVKAKIRYNQRNRIKIQVGVSSDLNAQVPAKVMDFPCFNFQGDSLPMQGFWGVNADLIEIGLDITPLMNYIPVNGQARIFLEVIQKSPDANGSGKIEKFSVLDYTNGINEVINTSGMIPISRNAITRLSVPINTRVNRPQIITDELPVAQVGTEYLFHLEANGTTGPYRYANPADQPTETPDKSTIDFSGGTDVFPIPDITARVMDLPFSFSFYGTSYSQVTVLKDGGIVMGQNLVKYPYVIDNRLRFYQNRGIFPFLTYLYYPDASKKVTFAASAAETVIRWHASADPEGTHLVEFALKMLPGGKIWFYYGDVRISPDISWISGLSAGNNLDYYLMDHNHSGVKMNSTFSLDLLDWPSWLSLESNGDLHGTTDKPGSWTIPFKVTDWNGISNNKELVIHAKGGSGAQTLTLNPGARVWPNPASGDLWLEASSTVAGNLTFTVYDLAGQQLFSRIFPARAGQNIFHCTDMKALKSGLYLYQVSGVAYARGKLMKKD